VVVVHADAPQDRLELVQQTLLRLLVARCVAELDRPVVAQRDAVLGAWEVLRREPEVDRVPGDEDFPTIWMLPSGYSKSLEPK
jgi:hypothetical protein